MIRRPARRAFRPTAAVVVTAVLVLAALVHGGPASGRPSAGTEPVSMIAGRPIAQAAATSVRKRRATTTVKKRRAATTTTRKRRTTTTRPRSTTVITGASAPVTPTAPPTASSVQTPVPTTQVPATQAPVTVPPPLPPIGDPAQTRPPDTAPGATVPAVTSTTRPGPTTTLPAAPPPAPALPPSRASAATLEPYRGLGAWVDMYDWTVQWSRRASPPVGLAQLDQMAASGVQTVFIQAAQWSSPSDVLEPALLVPMIERARQLGMQVVVWYLPGLQDVNTDLRKTVAIASLDVDGVQIDIEDRVIVANVAERNRRLQIYLSQLRALLPGRALTADIVSPILLDAVADRWTYPGVTSRTPTLWWGGPFPYADLVAIFDLIAIQAYWTDRSATGGWRDPYQNITESVRRVRAAAGRADYPVQVIGGIPNRATLNDVSGMLQAARDAGSFGLSVYDWATTPAAWWPLLWNARSVADPRFVPAAAAPFVPHVQPPPPTTTTTSTTTTTPTTTAAPVPAPTLPPAA